MKNLNRMLAAAAAAGTLMPALAGEHLICYEGPLEMRNGIEVVKMVVGCHDDGGPGCKIAPGEAVGPLKGPFVLRPDHQLYAASWSVDVPGATFEFYEYENTPGETVLTMSAQVTFNGSGRSTDCVIEPYGKTLGGMPGHADGVLTGFSTDVSGHATTGVWRKTGGKGFVRARVPADFIVVGGGAQAQDGAFVQDARFDPYGDLRVWEVRSFTPTFGNPARTESYAIGLKFRGLSGDAAALNRARGSSAMPGDDLRQKIQEASQGSGSAGQVAPSAGASEPADHVLLGGSIAGTADLDPRQPLAGEFGLFAATSAPSRIGWYLRCVMAGKPCSPPWATGWQAESLSDGARRPGHIDLRLRSMPARLSLPNGQWEVRSRLAHHTSAPSPAPRADVAGLRGEFALTGVGAALHWRRFNAQVADVSTLLTAFVPQLQQGGTSARSANASTASVAALSALAVGIKLVPEGTPPEVEEPRPELMLNLSWLCDAVPELRKTRLCQAKEEAMLVTNICLTYPELRELGYCLEGDKR